MKKLREQDRGNIKETEKQTNKAGNIKSIPAFWKSFIMKFWFAGALFFIFMMSEFSLVIDKIDVVVAYGLALGLAISVIDYVLRTSENGDGKHTKYILFNSKKWLHFLLNILYGVFCAIIIMFIYGAINKIIIQIGDYTDKHIGLPAEPIGVGTAFILIDLAFINLKVLFKKIFNIKSESTEFVSDEDTIVSEWEN